jgi:hypothetical protein
MLLLLLLQFRKEPKAVSLATELASGALFAFGLVYTGMVRPTKVRRRLNPSQAPSPTSAERRSWQLCSNAECCRICCFLSSCEHLLLDDGHPLYFCAADVYLPWGSRH